MNERDYKKFFTPIDVVDKLIALAELGQRMDILEPSAGNGAIVRRIKEAQPSSIIHAVEINPYWEHWLDEAGASEIYIQDFTKDSILNYLMDAYPRIIANPPFGNGINFSEHFYGMWSFLDYGGILVTIAPDDFEPQIDYEKIPLKNWSKNSDGTETKICIIKVKRPLIPFFPTQTPTP